MQMGTIFMQIHANGNNFYANICKWEQFLSKFVKYVHIMGGILYANNCDIVEKYISAYLCNVVNTI